MKQDVHLLQGTWTLVAADAIRADGVRVRDYGEQPGGRLVVDAAGRYSLQIFKRERRRFRSADKSAGSPEDYQSAVMGSSTHYGTVEVDERAGTLTFRIEGSSFPNWEGTVQVRGYDLSNGQLSYRVPPRADGSTPLSVWQRLPAEVPAMKD